ncbi:unnamed protein product [Ilex paraguariensis]|uniref:Uncharacterized protein n=1 Tax=Ilex paraguariensis TaxID=185542 RepID=A0ABC8UVH5_9AQUA
MTRLCTCTGRLASKFGLTRKGNQLPKPPCKTCGGRPFVHRRGPVSASMLSTVGLELKNFIDPDLSWKTLTKGRRSRKPAAGRSFNVGAKLGNKSAKRVWGSSVSESEKLCVAVLGQHFSDKAEHVRINKRRRLIRSQSSLPRTPSQHHEESLSRQAQTSSPHSELIVEVDGRVMDDNGSEVTKGKLCYTGDFSGIALLAAAACISSIGDEADNGKEDLVEEEFSTPQVFDSFTSTIPLEEPTALTASGNQFRKDLVHEDYVDASFVQDNSVDFQTIVSGVNEDGMQREKLEKSGSCEARRDSEVIEESDVQAPVCRIVSADVHEEYAILDQKGAATGPSKSSTEERSSEACYGHDRIYIDEKYICTSTGCALEPLSCNSSETKAYSHVVSIDASLYSSPCHVSHNISDTCVFEEKMDTASANISVIQNSDDCCRTSTSRLGRITSSESIQLRKQDVTVADVPDSEKTICEYIVPSKGHEDFGKTYSFPDVISTAVFKPVDFDSFACNSDKVDPSLPSPECEDLSASATSGVGEREGQPIVISDAKGENGRIAAGVDFLEHMEPKELMSQCSDHPVSNRGAHGGFISLESCKSNIDDPTHGSGESAENVTQLPAGYDSPFEDGELRESVLYSWEDETECVDYESDNRGGDEFDESDNATPEKVEVGDEGSQIVEKGTSFGTEVMEADFSKSESMKTSNIQLMSYFTIDDIKETEMVGKEGLSAGSSIPMEQSANMFVQVNDGGARKSQSSDHMDGLDVKWLDISKVRSRTSCGKKLSRVQGPSIVDISHRKDTVRIQHGRSHYLGGSYSRAENDFDSVKPMRKDRSSLHEHERDEEEDYWIDSSVDYWDSRNSRSRHPPSHRDSYTKPSVTNDSAANVGGLNCCDHRKILSFSSRGMYRSPIRRRLPVDREDDFVVHRDRSRGRSEKYPQGLRRCPREGYHDHVPDDGTALSVHMPYHSARRDRSFSPTFSRGGHISRPFRKPRSKSRTRSPPAWHLQRERNLGTRRYSRSPDIWSDNRMQRTSRSPDFRSDGRMQRTRFISENPRIAIDYEGSFVSPPGSRFSPRCDSRRFDDQNSGEGHLREWRSPVRNFRQSQRFHSVNSSGRLKPDGYLRPTVRPRRFPPVAGTSVGCKYENMDDYRRHDNRGDTIHWVKRNGTGGARRFLYDGEDCFEGCNSHYKDDCTSSDRRDLPRSVGEHRSSFRYNNNRI